MYLNLVESMDWVSERCCNQVAEEMAVNTTLKTAALVTLANNWAAVAMAVNKANFVAIVAMAANSLQVAEVTTGSTANAVAEAKVAKNLLTPLAMAKVVSNC